MTFMELARKRFSCRKFSDKSVEPEKLQAVLEACNVAPTAKNDQAHRIYVLQSPEVLAKVDQMTHCRYNAPVVLLFAYDSEEDWKNPLEEGVHSGIEDAAIVATHAMLQAAELGLDTCWVNYFPNTKLERELGLPETERSVLLLPMGYGDMSPGPKHTEKKPLSETVRYL